MEGQATRTQPWTAPQQLQAHPTHPVDAASAAAGVPEPPPQAAAGLASAGPRNSSGGGRGGTGSETALQRFIKREILRKRSPAEAPPAGSGPIEGGQAVALGAPAQPGPAASKPAALPRPAWRPGLSRRDPRLRQPVQQPDAARQRGGGGAELEERQLGGAEPEEHGHEKRRRVALEAGVREGAGQIPAPAPAAHPPLPLPPALPPAEVLAAFLPPVPPLGPAMGTQAGSAPQSTALLAAACCSLPPQPATAAVPPAAAQAPGEGTIGARFMQWLQASCALAKSADKNSMRRQCPRCLPCCRRCSWARGFRASSAGRGRASSASHTIPSCKLARAPGGPLPCISSS